MSERDVVWWPSRVGRFHLVSRPLNRVLADSHCGVTVYRPQYPLAGKNKCGRCRLYFDALQKRQPERADVRL